MEGKRLAGSGQKGRTWIETLLGQCPACESRKDNLGTGTKASTEKHRVGAKMSERLRVTMGKGQEGFF